MTCALAHGISPEPMKKTLLPPAKGTEPLHEIAAEAAAKNHLKGGKRSDFPKYLRAAMQSKDIEAPYLADKDIKAIAGEVANALTRNGTTSAKEIGIVCKAFDDEAEQVEYWTGRAWEVGEKIPDDWLELIQMCERIFHRI